MNGDDLFGGWGEPAWGNTGTGAATNAASLSMGWGNPADELRCGMCGHFYNDPRTLGCGHSYCACCLTQSAAGVGAVSCLVCGRQERLPPLMGVDGLQKNYDLADRAEAAARSAPADEADDTSAGGAYDFQDFQAALPPTIPQHQQPQQQQQPWASHTTQSVAQLMPVLPPVSAAPKAAAAARPSGAPAAFDPFGDLLQPAPAAAAPVDFFGGAGSGGGGAGGSSPFASSTSFLAPVPATVAAAAPVKPATPQHAKLVVREDLTESMDEFTKFLLTESKSATPVSTNPYFPNGDPFAMPAPAPAKKAPLAFLSSSPPPSSPAAATSAPTTPTAQSSYRVSSVVPSRVTPTSSSSATASSSSMTSMYPSSSPYHPSSSASAYPMLSSSPPSVSSSGLASSPPPATSASDSSSSTLSGSTSTSSYLSSMSPASWFSKKDSTKAASSSSASASSSSSSSSTSSGVLSFFSTKSSAAPAATATTAAAAAPAAAVAHTAAAPPRPAAPAQHHHHHHHSQAVTDHSQHQDAGRINFSNFLLQKEGIRQKFNGWLESLWFKPAGFFDNVQNATMQFVFVPFWMFDVKVQTAYQGKVCRVVMTGSDAQAKKVESWSEAQGNRSALYPHKTVCACQSVQERKLVQQFTTPWQVNKIHFGVDRNPQQPQQAPQQQQQPQHQQSAEEGWGVGKFFKKIADSVEKVAAMPTTVVKPPPPNLLLPALPWEGVWKEFEAELVKLETQECSNKLRVENGADKVKDVALNYQVQLNRRLVYFPVCLTSYQYNGKLYRVVINGHTGEVIGDRPYGTGKIGELGKAGLSVVGDYLFKRGGSSS